MIEEENVLLKTKITDLPVKEIFKRVSNILLLGKKSIYIVTPNPEIALQALKDNELREIIRRADFSLCDGVGLLWAARVFGSKIRQRITGSDFMLDLLRFSAKNNIKVGFLGAGSGIAQKAKQKAQKLYPGIKIVYANEGMSVKDFSLDNSQCLRDINKAGVQLLFVAFGAPRQEKWVGRNLTKLSSVRVAMVVGGGIDYLAGVNKRAPVWARKMGLEWLFRLIWQPSRWLRIWNATAKFISVVLWWRLRMTFCYRQDILVLIYNNKNKILLVRSARYEDEIWQLPQGGVELGEDFSRAVLREMKEELGTDNFQIIKRVRKFNAYKWPHWARMIQGYKGQKQDLFILRYQGRDSEFDLVKGGELAGYMWLNIQDAVKKINKQRRGALVKAVSYLGFNKK